MELWTVGMIVRWCERETYSTLLCNLKKKKNKRTFNESIRSIQILELPTRRSKVQKCFFFFLKVLKSNVKCKQMLSKEKCCYMWLFFFPTKKSEHNYLIFFQKVKKSKKKKNHGRSYGRPPGVAGAVVRNPQLWMWYIFGKAISLANFGLFQDFSIN